MYFFTSDEHFGHKKILLPEYCDRRARMAVLNVEEMNEVLIANHNERVTPQDVTVHAGDFCWHKKFNQQGDKISSKSSRTDSVEKLVKRLNGSHIFIRGSHDAWLPSSAKYMWRKMVDLPLTKEQVYKNAYLFPYCDMRQFIVVCHYAMRRWERSHYGSWQLYGHSHGRLEPIGLQHDIGVDANNFYPVSLVDLVEIMKHKTQHTKNGHTPGEL